MNWGNIGINIDGEHLNHLRFADDIILIAYSIEDARRMMQELHSYCHHVGLKINFSKTQYMTNLVVSENLLVADRFIDKMVSQISRS